MLPEPGQSARPPRLARKHSGQPNPGHEQFQRACARPSFISAPRFAVAHIVRFTPAAPRSPWALYNESERSKLPLRNTVTAAATAIPVLFYRTVFPANVFPFTFEITCVTRGTVRRILREWIRHRCAHGTAVAGAACRISRVVTGIVPAGIMAEDRRRPAVRRMADVTLDVSTQMQ